MKDISITKLPGLTHENLKAIMGKQLAVSKNPLTSIPMLWQGLVEMEIHVGAEVRTAKLYIPKHTPQGTSFVLLNVPQGETTVDFLQKSGWLELADKNPICLFAAEPKETSWLSQEQEQAYFAACVQAMFDGDYFRGGMSAYVAGYGDAGVCLHKEVLRRPLKIAAAAFIDAGEVNVNYLHSLEEDSMDADGMTFGLSLKEAPVPVWILQKQMTSQVRSAVRHWIRAMGEGEMQEDPSLGKVYTQGKDFVGTPDGRVVQVAVKEADVCYCDPKLTEQICSFLTGFVRFTKTGPYGSTLTRSVDYGKLGVDIRYFPDENGDLRECLIYVPKEFRDGRKLPVVFAIHGSSESIRNYFEESLWYRKAQKEGFIVVMPETSLYFMPGWLSGGIPKAYRPRWKVIPDEAEKCDGLKDDDLLYFTRILDSVIQEYPVDEERIYCTGHSNGCMMTNFIGSSPLGSRFAALAATSGVLRAWDPAGTEMIPIWMTMGEFDLWSYRLEERTQQTDAIDLWLVRNKIVSEENVQQVRISGASENPCDGRYHSRIWNNRQGIPMVRYDWIEKKDHMNTPGENFRFWDHWFSKWRLTKDQGRCYEGIPCSKGEISKPGFWK